MAEPFTFKAVHSRLNCGSEKPHVQLSNLLRPNGAKASRVARGRVQLIDCSPCSPIEG